MFVVKGKGGVISQADKTNLIAYNSHYPTIVKSKGGVISQTYNKYIITIDYVTHNTLQLLYCCFYMRDLASAHDPLLLPEEIKRKGRRTVKSYLPRGEM